MLWTSARRRSLSLSTTTANDNYNNNSSNSNAIQNLRSLHQKNRKSMMLFGNNSTTTTNTQHSMDMIVEEMTRQFQLHGIYTKKDTKVNYNNNHNHHLRHPVVHIKEVKGGITETLIVPAPPPPPTTNTALAAFYTRSRSTSSLGSSNSSYSNSRSQYTRKSSSASSSYTPSSSLSSSIHTTGTTTERNEVALVNDPPPNLTSSDVSCCSIGTGTSMTSSSTSSTSSTTATRKKIRKRVQFYQYVIEVDPIISIIYKDEMSNIWYATTEIMQMKQELRTIYKNRHLLGSGNNDNDGDPNYRIAHDMIQNLFYPINNTTTTTDANEQEMILPSLLSNNDSIMNNTTEIEIQLQAYIIAAKILSYDNLRGVERMLYGKNTMNGKKSSLHVQRYISLVLDLQQQHKSHTISIDDNDDIDILSLLIAKACIASSRNAIWYAQLVAQYIDAMDDDNNDNNNNTNNKKDRSSTQSPPTFDSIRTSSNNNNIYSTIIHRPLTTTTTSTKFSSISSFDSLSSLLPSSTTSQQMEV